jgi:hypothetical protein
MIRPRKCGGGFRILHAIHPKALPRRNVIAMFTGMNHLYDNTKLVSAQLN